MGYDIHYNVASEQQAIRHNWLHTRNAKARLLWQGRTTTYTISCLRLQTNKKLVAQAVPYISHIHGHVPMCCYVAKWLHINNFFGQSYQVLMKIRSFKLPLISSSSNVNLFASAVLVTGLWLTCLC